MLPAQRERRTFGKHIRHKRHAPAARQDDEEERVSKHSAGALPYRLRVRQAADKYAGDRKTKPLPPEKKMTDHCAFVLLMTKYQEEQQLCVES